MQTRVNLVNFQLEQETNTQGDTMNANTTTTPAVELTELQKLALELLAYNKPLPAKVTKRTLNSLVNKGWATVDEAGLYWVTAAGREAVGVTAEQAEKPKKASKAKRCEDCDVLLTSRTRTSGTLPEYTLCSYCDEAAGFENSHQDGNSELGDHAVGCRECGTYDACTYWDEFTPAKKGKTPKNCVCGCEQLTRGGNYLPGHDARHAGHLARRVVEGRETLEQALEQLPWGADKLEAKVRKSVELGLAKAQAKAEKKAAKQAK
ncbi:hypothetical protein SEA_GHOBES_47 [Gordonia phage Ghobes]|uniref:Uncharacterized protein n=1 Tax=Gordonia phage Ghobes TaxID=1887647 RepID=A0A1B3B089_9CAUD|nr:hypothetical protein KCH37_gp47 [Gordonia phage Ghobes]AOE44398.1 hypothetical protein SEA_GHOBES_47 [Gordonia phage Ghobes]